MLSSPIRSRRVALILAAFVSVAVSQPDHALAQSGQTSPSLPQVVKTPQPAGQEQYVSYWTTEPGWNT
jgi:hypothetical protein